MTSPRSQLLQSIATKKEGMEVVPVPSLVPAPPALVATTARREEGKDAAARHDHLMFPDTLAGLVLVLAPRGTTTQPPPPAIDHIRGALRDDRHQGGERRRDPHRGGATTGDHLRGGAGKISCH